MRSPPQKGEIAPATNLCKSNTVAPSVAFTTTTITALPLDPILPAIPARNAPPIQPTKNRSRMLPPISIGILRHDLKTNLAQSRRGRKEISPMQSISPRSLRLCARQPFF
jgi:hypothetical protein